ncbi:MAG: hypothetical protein Q8L55_02305 [Phycisphaerales bacterium]|nr:hypothetical protein [Phycisphaerales bacterium]
MRQDRSSASAGKNLVYGVEGRTVDGGLPRRLRLVAPSEAVARERAQSDGLVVESITCEGAPLTTRKKFCGYTSEDVTAMVVFVVLTVFFSTVLAVGGWAWWQEHQRDNEKAAVAAAKVEAERGPEWEEALAFAKDAIPPGSDGVGWFITRWGSGEPEMRYNTAKGEYRIKVHTYPRGMNPLTGSTSDRLYGGLIVRGSGKNWSVVKLVPYW